MHPLKTYGYQRGWLGDLVHEAKRGTLIADIRHQPFSRNPVWRKPALQKALGEAYHHEPRLGNLAYRGGSAVQLADASGGVLWLLSELLKRPVLLLCVCPLEARCHRSNVVALAKERCPELVHQPLIPITVKESLTLFTGEVF